MSIVTETTYHIMCDKCGEICSEDPWLCDTSAEEYAKNHGWITDEDRHYCPNCIEEE